MAHSVRGVSLAALFLMIVFAGGVLAPDTSHAQTSGAIPGADSEPEPPITELPCRNCLNRTPPKVLSSPLPRYPRGAARTWSEGWVIIRFTINSDGSVTSPAIVDGVGAQAFRQAAIETVPKWTYQPATENGAPVATYNKLVRIIYQYPDGVLPNAGLHTKVVREFNRARETSEQGKHAEAIAILKALLTGYQLSLLEITESEAALAAYYNNLGRPAEALHHIRRATLQGGKFLRRPNRGNNLRFRVLLEFMNGHYVEAQEALDEVARWEGALKADDSLTAMLAAFESRPSVARGVLLPWSEDSKEGRWTHKLYRPTFAFSDLGENVDRFELWCEAKAIASAVKVGFDWTVPKAWGDCTLEVFGAPGATFTLIQDD